MQPIYATHAASITELKKNPNALLLKAEGESIAILNHNRPSAYLVPATVYEDMIGLLEDYHLNALANERQEKNSTVEVTLDEL